MPSMRAMHTILPAAAGAGACPRASLGCAGDVARPEARGLKAPDLFGSANPCAAGRIPGIPVLPPRAPRRPQLHCGGLRTPRAAHIARPRSDGADSAASFGRGGPRAPGPRAEMRIWLSFYTATAWPALPLATLLPIFRGGLPAPRAALGLPAGPAHIY
jgi:hypothetical protein